MSEVEKLYRNANIKQDRMCKWTCKDSELCSTTCEHYESTQLYYPPLTAEKQLELIKLIANRKGYPDYEYFGNLFDDYVQLFDFNEALAKLVNTLWQGLTEEEKQQVKGILE